MDKSKFIMNLAANISLVSHSGVYFTVEEHEGEEPIMLGLGNYGQAQKYLNDTYPGKVIPV